MDYTHFKGAGRKQECGESQEKLAKHSMAGSDMQRSQGRLPGALTRPSSVNCTLQMRRNREEPSSPAVNLIALGWGELAVPEDSLSGWQWGGDSALSKEGVLGMFCIARLGPLEGITAPFLRMTKTHRDELSPARSHRQRAGLGT